MQHGPTDRTLSLGLWMLRPAHAWALMSAVLGLPVLVLVLLVHAVEARSEDGADVPGVLARLLVELAQEPRNRALLYTAAALLPIAVALLLVHRRSYLRITSAGLEGYIPPWLGLGLFGQTSGQWHVRWEDVQRVALQRTLAARGAVRQLGTYRLVIATGRGEVRLQPFLWFDGAGEDHRLGLHELLTPHRLDAMRRLRRAPLVRAFTTRGFEVAEAESVAEPEPSGFDLMQHKGLVAQLGLLFGAGLYALVDALFVGAYKPLGPLPPGPFVLVAAGAVTAAAKLGHGAPKTERRVVGALTVAACVGATYPATLRLNAATAEAEVAVYVSAGNGRFEAPDARLPPIDLSGEGIAEYLAQFPPGTQHEFTVMKGAAGFHQLELAPLFERTRRFYDSDAR